MSYLAVIPARGGSQRIPKKNIYPFIDEPMIAHTIRAADETGLFEHIHVSTDCAEIAKISEEYGFAPQFLRADFLIMKRQLARQRHGLQRNWSKTE